MVDDDHPRPGTPPTWEDDVDDHELSRHPAAPAHAPPPMESSCIILRPRGVNGPWSSDVVASLFATFADTYGRCLLRCCCCWFCGCCRRREEEGDVTSSPFESSPFPPPWSMLS
jgi:hypothetical protein